MLRCISRLAAEDAQFRMLAAEDAQSSIEAALLLPSLMFAMAFLLQPMCVLYTRSLMYHAAAETVRVAATATEDTDTSLLEAFAKRRLEAVPNLSIFHEGGASGWEIEIEDSSSAQPTVRITTRVQPLPLLGIFVQAFGTYESGSIVLTAEVTNQILPDWLQGSYSDWIEVWDV